MLTWVAGCSDAWGSEVPPDPQMVATSWSNYKSCLIFKSTLSNAKKCTFHHLGRLVLVEKSVVDGRQHHQVHLGDLFSAIFVFCCLYFVFCILHFECCILFFVLFLYSTPSSSPWSSPQWTICILLLVFCILYFTFWMLYFVLCIVFVFNTIKFTLELSSVDILYFAVCILYLVFYILNVVFCTLYCFCIQHHQVHLGALLSGHIVFCCLYFVSCILHFECCILYFVLFLYSTPSSSPWSSPRLMIGSSPRRQRRRKRRRPTTTISASRLLSSSWSPSPDPSRSGRGSGRRYLKLVVTFSTDILESIWEGVRGMLFLFLFDIFSENQTHSKISQIKVFFADTYPVLSSNFSLYCLISCSCALGTAWPKPPGPLPVQWLCQAKKTLHF